MNPDHLKSLIERILMKVPKFFSIDASELLFYTAVIESDCGRNLVQLGGGPALGVMGVEPRTMLDNYTNYLNYRQHVRDAVNIACGIIEPYSELLEFNIAFNVMMARIKYYRVKEPIPVTLEGKAKYHEKHYNTNEGNYPGPDWRYSLDKYLKFIG